MCVGITGSTREERSSASISYKSPQACRRKEARDLALSRRNAQDAKPKGIKIPGVADPEEVTSALREGDAADTAPDTELPEGRAATLEPATPGSAPGANSRKKRKRRKGKEKVGLPHPLLQRGPGGRQRGNRPPGGRTPGPTPTVPPTRPRTLKSPSTNFHLPHGSSRSYLRRKGKSLKSFILRTYTGLTPTTCWSELKMPKLKGQRRRSKSHSRTCSSWIGARRIYSTLGRKPSIC